MIDGGVLSEIRESAWVRSACCAACALLLPCARNWYILHDKTPHNIIPRTTAPSPPLNPHTTVFAALASAAPFTTAPTSTTIAAWRLLPPANA